MLESVIHRNGDGLQGQPDDRAAWREYGPKKAIPACSPTWALTVAAYDTVYRVVGSTGVVCMAMNFQPKKGEKGPPRFIRSTWMYAEVDGAWRLLSWHSSDLPLKK